MNTSMIGPTWLAAVFGIIMIVSTVYAAGRIVVAWRTRDRTDYDVDGHHVLMGISMAGMLIPSLRIVTPGLSTTIWIIIWILVTAWFAFSLARRPSTTRPSSRFARHHVPHLVMSAAMIYMLAAPAGMGRSSAASGMSGMGSAGLVPWPTLDALFLVFMAGYAVLVIDRYPNDAHAHAPNRQNPEVLSGASPSSSRRRFLDPRGAGVEDVVMAVTMGYMLTMMFV